MFGFRLALASLCLVPLAGQAAVGDAEIQAGLAVLRTQPALRMSWTGTERLGATVHPIGGEALWATQADGTLNVSLWSSRDGFEDYRMTGDGTTLFAMDWAKNEYRPFNYGVFQGTPGATYQDKLAQATLSLARSANAWPARVLRDTMSGSGAVFRPWTSGVDAVQAPIGTFTYSQGTPVVKQFTFTLDPMTRVLTSMNLYEAFRSGSLWREVQVQIDVQTFSTIPTGWTFAFTPPVGARPIQP